MNKFEDIKDNLQSGDMILCSGNYPISNIIREVTNSEYSHVGILRPSTAWTHKTEWYVYESVESVGVRSTWFYGQYLLSYGKTRYPYDGRIDIVRNKKLSEISDCPYCTQKTKPVFEKRLFDKAEELIGHKYNNKEITDIVKRIILNRHSGHPVDHGKYICSEYVYFCFKAAGIDLYYDDRGFISPKNILEDENVELIYKDVR